MRLRRRKKGRHAYRPDDTQPIRLIKGTTVIPQAAVDTYGLDLLQELFPETDFHVAD